MKVFWFLVIFVLVNVSADDYADYKKEVFLANEAIELAYNKNDLIVGDNSPANGLEQVIEKLVNDEEYFKCFGKINFMIAVPDKMDIINQIPGWDNILPMTKCKHYQTTMQIEIKNKLNIAIPRAESGQDFGLLNLISLSNKRRSLVKPALKNILRRKLGSLYNQFMMQLKSRDTILTGLKRLNLTTLTEERRVTGRSLENTITRRVLGTDIPDVDQEQNKPVRDDSLLRLCRLAGLYISTQFPTSYIKTLWIDPKNNNCILDDGITEIIYQKTNGLLWKIYPTT